MIVRRTLAMFPLTLTAAAVLAASGIPTPASASAAETTGERVFVQLKIKNGSKELSHPGHKMETGEELTLVLTEGKTRHEVMVYVEGAEAGFGVEVVYTRGGKERLKTQREVKGSQWVQFKSDDGKSLVSLRINPGTKRVDEVDVPGGKNPLDGV